MSDYLSELLKGFNQPFVDDPAVKASQDARHKEMRNQISDGSLDVGGGFTPLPRGGSAGTTGAGGTTSGELSDDALAAAFNAYGDNVSGNSIPLPEVDRGMTIAERDRRFGDIDISGASRGDTDYTDSERLGISALDSNFLDTNRAAKQGTMEQLGRGVNKAFWNTLYDLGSSVGSIGDVGDYGIPLFDDGDNELGNSWMRYFSGKKEELEKENQIYKREDAGVDSSAWWIDSMSGLASSAGAFAIEGAAIGALMTTGAGAAAGAVRGTQMVRRIAKVMQAARQGKKIAAADTALLKFGQHLNKVTTGQFLKNVDAIADGTKSAISSGILNQVESLGVGVQVWDETYKKAIDMGYDDIYARNVASHAAAHTMNINRANILLNLSSSHLMNVGGKALSLYGKVPGLGKMGKDSFRMSQVRGALGESAQEVAEELVNLSSEQQGTMLADNILKHGIAVGGKDAITGKNIIPEDARGYATRVAPNGLFATFLNGDFKYDRMFGDATSKEIFETGLLGAIGGLGQTGASMAIGQQAGSSKSLLNKATNNFFAERFGQKDYQRLTDNVYNEKGELIGLKGDLAFETENMKYSTDVKYSAGDFIESDITDANGKVIVQGNRQLGKTDIELIEKANVIKHKKGDEVEITNADGTKSKVTVPKLDKQGRKIYKREGGDDTYFSSYEMEEKRYNEMKGMVNEAKERAEKNMRVLDGARLNNSVALAGSAIEELKTSSYNDPDRRIELIDTIANEVAAVEMMMAGQPIEPKALLDRAKKIKDDINSGSTSTTTLINKQQEMLAIANEHNMLTAIQAGNEKELTEVYKEMMNLKPEQAEQLGYAPDYRERAQKSIDKIKKISDQYFEYKIKHGEDKARRLVLNRLYAEAYQTTITKLDQKANNTDLDAMFKEFAVKNGLKETDTDYKVLEKAFKEGFSKQYEREYNKELGASVKALKEENEKYEKELEQAYEDMVKELDRANSDQSTVVQATRNEDGTIKMVASEDTSTDVETDEDLDKKDEKTLSPRDKFRRAMNAHNRKVQKLRDDIRENEKIIKQHITNDADGRYKDWLQSLEDLGVSKDRRRALGEALSKLNYLHTERIKMLKELDRLDIDFDRTADKTEDNDKYELAKYRKQQMVRLEEESYRERLGTMRRIQKSGGVVVFKLPKMAYEMVEGPEKDKEGNLIKRREVRYVTHEITGKIKDDAMGRPIFVPDKADAKFITKGQADMYSNIIKPGMEKKHEELMMNKEQLEKDIRDGKELTADEIKEWETENKKKYFTLKDKLKKTEKDLQNLQFFNIVKDTEETEGEGLYLVAPYYQALQEMTVDSNMFVKTKVKKVKSASDKPRAIKGLNIGVRTRMDENATDEQKVGDFLSIESDAHPFAYEGRDYKSVEHALLSNYTGKFDQAQYDSPTVLPNTYDKDKTRAFLVQIIAAKLKDKRNEEMFNKFIEMGGISSILKSTYYSQYKSLTDDGSMDGSTYLKILNNAISSIDASVDKQVDDDTDTDEDTEDDTEGITETKEGESASPAFKKGKGFKKKSNYEWKMVPITELKHNLKAKDNKGNPVKIYISNNPDQELSVDSKGNVSTSGDAMGYTLASGFVQGEKVQLMSTDSSLNIPISVNTINNMFALDKGVGMMYKAANKIDEMREGYEMRRRIARRSIESDFEDVLDQRNAQQENLKIVESRLDFIQKVLNNPDIIVSFEPSVTQADIDKETDDNKKKQLEEARDKEIKEHEEGIKQLYKEHKVILDSFKSVYQDSISGSIGTATEGVDQSMKDLIIKVKNWEDSLNVLNTKLIQLKNEVQTLNEQHAEIETVVGSKVDNEILDMMAKLEELESERNKGTSHVTEFNKAIERFIEDVRKADATSDGYDRLVDNLKTNYPEFTNAIEHLEKSKDTLLSSRPRPEKLIEIRNTVTGLTGRDATSYMSKLDKEIDTLRDDITTKEADRDQIVNKQVLERRLELQDSINRIENEQQETQKVITNLENNKASIEKAKLEIEMMKEFFTEIRDVDTYNELFALINANLTDVFKELDEQGTLRNNLKELEILRNLSVLNLSQGDMDIIKSVLDNAGIEVSDKAEQIKEYFEKLIEQHYPYPNSPLDSFSNVKISGDTTDMSNDEYREFMTDVVKKLEDVGAIIPDTLKDSISNIKNTLDVDKSTSERIAIQQEMRELLLNIQSNSDAHTVIINETAKVIESIRSAGSAFDQNLLESYEFTQGQNVDSLIQAVNGEINILKTALESRLSKKDIQAGFTFDSDGDAMAVLSSNTSPLKMRLYMALHANISRELANAGDIGTDPLQTVGTELITELAQSRDTALKRRNEIVQGINANSLELEEIRKRNDLLDRSVDRLAASLSLLNSDVVDLHNRYKNNPKMSYAEYKKEVEALEKRIKERSVQGMFEASVDNTNRLMSIMSALDSKNMLEVEIEAKRMTVIELVKQLSALEYSLGIEDSFNKISELETNAKKLNEFNDIRKRYEVLLQKRIASVQRDYNLDNDYIDQLNQLKADLDNLGDIKSLVRGINFTSVMSTGIESMMKDDVSELELNSAVFMLEQSDEVLEKSGLPESTETIRKISSELVNIWNTLSKDYVITDMSVTSQTIKDDVRQLMTEQIAVNREIAITTNTIESLNNDLDDLKAKHSVETDTDALNSLQIMIDGGTDVLIKHKDKLKEYETRAAEIDKEVKDFEGKVGMTVIQELQNVISDLDMIQSMYPGMATNVANAIATYNTSQRIMTEIEKKYDRLNALLNIKKNYTPERFNVAKGAMKERSLTEYLTELEKNIKSSEGQLSTELSVANREEIENRKTVLNNAIEIIDKEIETLTKDLEKAVKDKDDLNEAGNDPDVSKKAIEKLEQLTKERTLKTEERDRLGIELGKLDSIKPADLLKQNTLDTYLKDIQDTIADYTSARFADQAMELEIELNKASDKKTEAYNTFRTTPREKYNKPNPDYDTNEKLYKDAEAEYESIKKLYDGALSTYQTRLSTLHQINNAIRNNNAGQLKNIMQYHVIQQAAAKELASAIDKEIDLLNKSIEDLATVPSMVNSGGRDRIGFVTSHRVRYLKKKEVIKEQNEFIKKDDAIKSNEKKLELLKKELYSFVDSGATDKIIQAQNTAIDTLEEELAKQRKELSTLKGKVTAAQNDLKEAEDYIRRIQYPKQAEEVDVASKLYLSINQSKLYGSPIIRGLNYSDRYTDFSEMNPINANPKLVDGKYKQAKDTLFATTVAYVGFDGINDRRDANGVPIVTKDVHDLRLLKYLRSAAKEINKDSNKTVLQFVAPSVTTTDPRIIHMNSLEYFESEGKVKNLTLAGADEYYIEKGNDPGIYQVIVNNDGDWLYEHVKADGDTEYIFLSEESFRNISDKSAYNPVFSKFSAATSTAAKRLKKNGLTKILLEQLNLKTERELLTPNFRKFTIAGSEFNISRTDMKAVLEGFDKDDYNHPLVDVLRLIAQSQMDTYRKTILTQLGAKPVYTAITGVYYNKYANLKRQVTERDETNWRGDTVKRVERSLTSLKDYKDDINRIDVDKLDTSPRQGMVFARINSDPNASMDIYPSTVGRDGALAIMMMLSELTRGGTGRRSAFNNKTTFTVVDENGNDAGTHEGQFVNQNETRGMINMLMNWTGKPSGDGFSNISIWVEGGNIVFRSGNKNYSVNTKYLRDTLGSIMANNKTVDEIYEAVSSQASTSNRSLLPVKLLFDFLSNKKHKVDADTLSKDGLNEVYLHPTYDPTRGQVVLKKYTGEKPYTNFLIDNDKLMTDVYSPQELEQMGLSAPNVSYYMKFGNEVYESPKITSKTKAIEKIGPKSTLDYVDTSGVKQSKQLEVSRYYTLILSENSVEETTVFKVDSVNNTIGINVSVLFGDSDDITQMNIRSLQSFVDRYSVNNLKESSQEEIDMFDKASKKQSKDSTKDKPRDASKGTVKSSSLGLDSQYDTKYSELDDITSTITNSDIDTMNSSPEVIMDLLDNTAALGMSIPKVYGTPFNAYSSGKDNKLTTNNNALLFTSPERTKEVEGDSISYPYMLPLAKGFTEEAVNSIRKNLDVLHNKASGNNVNFTLKKGQKYEYEKDGKTVIIEGDEIGINKITTSFKIKINGTDHDVTYTNERKDSDIDSPMVLTVFKVYKDEKDVTNELIKNSLKDPDGDPDQNDYYLEDNYYRYIDSPKSTVDEKFTDDHTAILDEIFSTYFESRNPASAAKRNFSGISGLYSPFLMMMRSNIANANRKNFKTLYRTYKEKDFRSEKERFEYLLRGYSTRKVLSDNKSITFGTKEYDTNKEELRYEIGDSQLQTSGEIIGFVGDGDSDIIKLMGIHYNTPDTIPHPEGLDVNHPNVDLRGSTIASRLKFKDQVAPPTYAFNLLNKLQKLQDDNTAVEDSQMSVPGFLFLQMLMDRKDAEANKQLLSQIAKTDVVTLELARHSMVNDIEGLLNSADSVLPGIKNELSNVLTEKKVEKVDLDAVIKDTKVLNNEAVDMFKVELTPMVNTILTNKAFNSAQNRISLGGMTADQAIEILLNLVNNPRYLESNDAEVNAFREALLSNKAEVINAIMKKFKENPDTIKGNSLLKSIVANEIGDRLNKVYTVPVQDNMNITMLDIKMSTFLSKGYTLPTEQAIEERGKSKKGEKFKDFTNKPEHKEYISLKENIELYNLWVKGRTEITKEDVVTEMQDKQVDTVIAMDTLIDIAEKNISTELLPEWYSTLPFFKTLAQAGTDANVKVVLKDVKDNTEGTYNRNDKTITLNTNYIPADDGKAATYIISTMAHELMHIVTINDKGQMYTVEDLKAIGAGEGAIKAIEQLNAIRSRLISYYAQPGNRDRLSIQQMKEVMYTLTGVVPEGKEKAEISTLMGTILNQLVADPNATEVQVGNKTYKITSGELAPMVMNKPQVMNAFNAISIDVLNNLNTTDNASTIDMSVYRGSLAETVIRLIRQFISFMFNVDVKDKHALDAILSANAVLTASQSKPKLELSNMFKTFAKPEDLINYYKKSSNADVKKLMDNFDSLNFEIQC